MNIKLPVAHVPGMPGRFSSPPRVGDPDMHHGTCVKQVPSREDRLLAVPFEVSGEENVLGIPGACATHNFTYLAKGPWHVKKDMSLTLYVLNFKRKHKHVFTFYVIPPYWHAKDNWNPSSCKTRTYLFHIVNIMVADDLATQGARVSAAMVLT